jgi:xylan 1,4-beta-xylosidase
MKFTAAIVLLTPLVLSAAELEVDCAKQVGPIRPLHGGNGGVLNDGGLTDLSKYFREAKIPLMRLHDCHWPNPDVVDMHVVFPNPKADPADPKSYDFRRTDEYVAAIRATGAKIVYRLGESIEHTKAKYHVHPPADFQRWAEACVGIASHYRDIEYWEIWNEPENRPAMWSGTDEDYLQLYEVTAKALKAKFGHLKVGGPSLGHTGKIVEGKFEPSEFMIKFLEYCRSKSLPLDFFSWHLYSDDPAECMIRAKGIREALDRFGFAKTELHFNEWNYLPNKDWKPVILEGQGEARKKFNEQMTGPASAAFAASVLINLQDTPVDQANYFRADNGGFGLFAPDGTPNKPYFAFKAFAMLLETPVRLETRGNDVAKLSLLAGINEHKNTVGILISNFKSADEVVDLSISGIKWAPVSECHVYMLDSRHDLARVRSQHLRGDVLKLRLEMKAPSVCFIRLMPPRP